MMSVRPSAYLGRTGLDQTRAVYHAGLDWGDV